MRRFDLSWLHPPESLTLADDEVHVWRASLDLPGSHIQRLHHILIADEQKRAGRFHFQKDRDRFIVAHGVLRAILSCYLGVEPGQLCFCYNPYGKPALTKEFGGERVRFNMAHSRGLAIYALTCGREIGIDLEYVRADLADGQIAECFFSHREVAMLRAVPKNLQKEAFFNCWTRKEAYVKARGEGLSLPLDQFDVSLTPGEPAELLSTPGDSPEAAHWSLQALSPGPGYAAALAVEGCSWRLKCWQWPAHL